MCAYPSFAAVAKKGGFEGERNGFLMSYIIDQYCPRLFEDFGLEEFDEWIEAQGADSECYHVLKNKSFENDEFFEAIKSGTLDLYERYLMDPRGALRRDLLLSM